MGLGYLIDPVVAVSQSPVAATGPLILLGTCLTTLSMMIWCQRVSTAVMKQRDQSNLEGKGCDQSNLDRKGFIWFTYPESWTPEGNQGRGSKQVGTWRQELMQRPWKGAAYWLAPHGFLSLLSYRSQDHSPGMAPSSHQSPTKKMPYNLILWRHLLNWVFLLSDNSSLCRVDINTKQNSQ